jgi:signal transduction histidine kinase
MLESQENERSRIAANLHDSLGQSLLVIKNQAQLAMQTDKDATTVQQRLDEISEIASQAVEEVRQITHDLRPYQLDRLGLTQAIRAITKRVAENSSIQFASHVDDIDGILGKDSEIHVYRIVQESLNNIIKHSDAAEATVVVKKQAAMISMSFRDNGRGFDANLLEAGGQANAGFGLGGIAERTKILGGKMGLESQPEKGTNLSITIPVFINETRTENIDR